MKIIKRFICMLIILLCCCLLNANAEKINNVVVPYEADFYQSKHFSEVASMFSELGLTNILLEPIDDLIFGWLTEDGDVEEVIIDGDKQFEADSVFASDSQVVIRYHAFPLDITIPHDSSDYYADGTRYTYKLTWTVESLIEHLRKLGFTNIIVEEYSHRDFCYDKIYRLEIDGDWRFDKGDVYKSDCQVKILVSAPNTTLTVENCDDLKEFLTGASNSYLSFADKYDGETIEFDGYISSSHSYNAGIDHVVSVAYGDPSIDGPSMKIETEGLSINNRYVRVAPAEMTRVHVVAEVDEYYTDYYDCLHLEAVVLVDQETWDHGRLLTINTDPYTVN